MTGLPEIFPFSKLKLPEGEALKWVGYNPTFHRFLAYGLAISDSAFYVCRPSWLFPKWKRYSLFEISDVQVSTSRIRPAIHFRVMGRKVSFRAPFDLHEDERELDRSVLSRAAGYLNSSSV